MISNKQCSILTSVDSDEPVQSPFKLRNSKYCSVSSLTLIEYAQADLMLCWSHIPHWKSPVGAQMHILGCNCIVA